MDKSKQVRLNFYEKDFELYEHLATKSSMSAYIKDLIRVDMLRERNYIAGNGGFGFTSQVVTAPPVIEISNEETFDFDLNDLGLD